ncbi:predicted protein [Postia placenta Mad-698-R]|nr:predicted protein [Postia placenta Mad-698-R]
MGNNKEALTLIIEQLGDVKRAINFAKEQHDDDLWEGLLKYFETRPRLKGALMEILHDLNLQASLLERCQTILNGDAAELARQLHRNQTCRFFLSAQTVPYGLDVVTGSSINLLSTHHMAQQGLDQGFDGSWGDAGIQQPPQPAPPEAGVNPTDTADRILFQAVAALGRHQDAFANNQQLQSAALESLARSIHELRQRVSATPAPSTSAGPRNIKVRDPRMFNGKSSEVVPFLRESHVARNERPGRSTISFHFYQTFEINPNFLRKKTSMIRDWIKELGPI